VLFLVIGVLSRRSLGFVSLITNLAACGADIGGGVVDVGSSGDALGYQPNVLETDPEFGSDAGDLRFINHVAIPRACDA
jgi:hypothetical protein